VTSTARSYFEMMYAQCDDPWQFATSAYEQRKYELTVVSLPRSHYENVFEPGCSIGVLSERLAARCQQLLATDIVSDALVAAAERLKQYPHVRVEQRAIPEQWPEDVFDLIVLSEVAYYFDESALGEVVDHVVRTTAPGSHVVAVHWRGETDYPLTGDQAHEVIARTEQLRAVVHHEEEQFVLDVWERVR
jgi:2-polyprenyl-3-methyl-5-hydroxy-6-metoxy-1,4-benzoquinol methylase